MRLKSLSLKGFKTFSEKEELVFDPACGITAIVGPNGCGKSNVVDAFRFALGEGNFRELRIHSIPEVIFAGTQARKPLSMAEVALSFDNSDKSLAIDYSEISVKRRVFRDGESEFLINNQVCRLKDIRDVFLDTGLSTESLSIMSQGNVDSILSSKPEERRAVFEEVAGINKYKFRKMEAERKLILSEQNLLRISDLKIEVSEQLLSLEAQAKAAREYKEIRDKLKQIELSALKKQAKLLIEKKERVSQELEKNKQLAAAAEDKRRIALEEKAARASHLKETEASIDRILSQIEKIKEKMEEERGQKIVERERQLFDEKSKLRDIKEEERFIRFEIKRIEDSLKSLAAKKSELLSRRPRAGSENLDEFGDFKSVIELTSKASAKLKEIVLSHFGKAPYGSTEDASSRGFYELIDAEILRINEEAKANEGELGFKLSKVKETEKILKQAESDYLKLAQSTEEFLKTPTSRAMEDLNVEKSKKLSELDSLRADKQKISQAIEELEKQSMLYPEGERGGSGDMVRLEVAAARAESELSQIESHVRDEYSLSLEDLLSFEGESANLNKDKKEIEPLKTRMRELEPINLLAIDEYEKCRERHTFIETQHQDVLLARENLKTLITELDLKAREDFIKSMEIVAKNFSEVFSELFMGGEAQILLEKDKDALSAGIEITVRHEHRKWLGLSLLSGGERALTAIALLFAILKTSPSPLCILDEVDAALDDANIGRFAAYLKKFSENTQIIVITHNKRTMAVADVIYGVTMEEPGVSQVVSMKLEAAN